jgi:hypothetical protein
VLTGFTATADPLRTSSFKVTSVRVVGPLFGLQSKNGYDMRPNTKLTTAQFRGFFTAWHYDPKPMIWDGLYVSIQPIQAKAAPVGSPKPAVVPPTPAPTPVPTPSPSPSPSPTPNLSQTPAPSASPAAIAVAAADSSGLIATSAPRNVPVAANGPETALLLVLAILAILGVGAWRVAGPISRRRR